MNVTGIIAEYNPFHNGHAYQLAEARLLTHADYLIIAMSGDFLQRGVPSIADKHTRAEMALSAGADLVLELPVSCATGSAEFFADGGIRLLAATGAVNTVCYGVECPQPALLEDIAALLVSPPASFDSQLAALVREGASYPDAREQALLSALPQYSEQELHAFLAKPNHILAIEYEKALLKHNRTGQSPMTGLGIRRVGDGYHESAVRSSYASATAIRRLLLELRTQGMPAAAAAPQASAPDSARILSILSEQLPAQSLSLLLKAAQERLLLSADDFSDALYLRLLSEQTNGYSSFADCTNALSNRIQEHLHEYLSFSQFAKLLKTRDLTRTRINRVLTHILLNIRRSDCAAGPIPYLRVLGFTRRAEALLTEISKKASAPLLTKVADAPRILSDPAMQMLKQDIHAADIYRGISRIRSGRPLGNEYNTAIIIP